MNKGIEVLQKKHGKQQFFSRCLDNLVAKKRIPMLFIGSGISKRYIKDYPTWEELLTTIASKIGVNHHQLLAMKQSITNDNPSADLCDIYKAVGSRLTELFRTKVESGELDLNSIFTDDEIAEIESKRIPFIKMLIAKSMKNYTLLSGTKIDNELKEFKKNQETIGAVITTNYDQFLEKEIFNNFVVYSDQTQYYMNDCSGIGEIYKIHGSVTSPQNIIFNKTDYENFDNNLKGIASRILSLAFDYPIIFMGYSLEDHNVQNILYTLIDCLSDAQLKEIAQNIIYVNWKPSEFRLVQTKKTITSNGRSLTMTNIDTDNYYAIYKYLQRFTPSERPERVRKYKKMIRELIVKSNTGQKTIVAEQNLDKLNSENNLVVAFCNKETLSYKGLIGFSVQDMINDVLSQTVYNSEQAKKIGIDVYNENSGFVKTNYIPIFYYLKNIDRDLWGNDPKINAAYSNCKKMIDTLLSNDKICAIDFDTLMKKRESLALYMLFSVAMKSYALGSINYEQYIEFLNEMGKDKNNRNSTHFKKAITYADFKLIAEKASH